MREVISQNKVDSPQNLALGKSSKGNGMNVDENMVSIDTLDPNVGSSSKLNGLNVDKAPSSCPIRSRLGKSCVFKPKKNVSGPPPYGPLVNEDHGFEPTTLAFGSRSVKDKRSARKERTATPTRSSIYIQAT
ncbi:hypothetical protein ACFE04_021625 [Oxalis oulophora]